MPAIHVLLPSAHQLLVCLARRRLFPCSPCRPCAPTATRRRSASPINVRVRFTGIKSILLLAGIHMLVRYVPDSNKYTHAQRTCLNTHATDSQQQGRRSYKTDANERGRRGAEWWRSLGYIMPQVKHSSASEWREPPVRPRPASRASPLPARQAPPEP